MAMQHAEWTLAGRMAKLGSVCGFIFLLLLATTSCLARHEEQHKGRGRSAFTDLKPRQPREIFSSEGGKIEKYDPEDYEALCEAEIGATRVTLESDGLVLPCYTDSDVLLVVTKGRMRTGIVSPFADRATEKSVFELRMGDVLAIPRGFAAWLYNDAEDQAQFLDFADTAPSTGCGCYRVFHLVGETGGEDGSGMLQGFSRDIIAHAWDVDELMVQRITEGQRGRMIIKVREHQRQNLPSVSNNGLYMSYVYRLGDAQPDVKVRDAGELRHVNSMKLPILKKLGISTSCIRLEAGAVKAPAWVHNAHKLIYAVEGRGRVQIVRENGERAEDVEMEEGRVLVVPANYASAGVAGKDGFDYSVFYKTDIPIESFMAGRNSVYRGIPTGILSSALEVDEKLVHKLEERRAEDAYMFPARRPRSSAFF